MVTFVSQTKAAVPIQIRRNSAKKSLQKQFYDAVIILSCSYSLCDYDHHWLQAAEKGFVQHHLLEPLLEARQDFDYLFFLFYCTEKHALL